MNRTSYCLPLSHSRRLELVLEPGVRPAPLYQLRVVSSAGMTAGSFVFDRKDMYEFLLALSQLTDLVASEGSPK